MLFFMLGLIALVVVFGVAKSQSDKLAGRYPVLKRPLEAVGWLASLSIWGAIIAAAVWVNNRPDPLPKPLPEYIQPPPLGGTAWTVYDRSSRDSTEMSLALATRQIKNGYAQVWSRFDDKAKQEVTLTLTRYECEFGKRTDLYDVVYDKGVYSGFAEDDPKDETKVDLETVEGSGFLLACYDKMPNLIDND